MSAIIPTKSVPRIFNALDRDEDMPLTSFADAARTFEVIFAADQSAASGGQPVVPRSLT